MLPRGCPLDVGYGCMNVPPVLAAVVLNTAVTVPRVLAVVVLDTAATVVCRVWAWLTLPELHACLQIAESEAMQGRLSCVGTGSPCLSFTRACRMLSLRQCRGVCRVWAWLTLPELQFRACRTLSRRQCRGAGLLDRQSS